MHPSRCLSLLRDPPGGFTCRATSRSAQDEEDEPSPRLLSPSSLARAACQSCHLVMSILPGDDDPMRTNERCRTPPSRVQTPSRSPRSAW